MATGTQAFLGSFSSSAEHRRFRYAKPQNIPRRPVKWATNGRPHSNPLYLRLPCVKGGVMRSMTEGLLQSRKTTPQALALRKFFVFAREIVGVQPTKKNSARRCASRTAHPLHRGAKKGTNFGSFLFSVFTFSYLPSRMEATAMRVKMTHASARVISFAAL